MRSKPWLTNHFVGKNFVFDERMGERVTSDVLGRCRRCGGACDRHVNCTNDSCHALLILCAACGVEMGGCCCEECRQFAQLPREEQKRRQISGQFKKRNYYETTSASMTTTTGTTAYLQQPEVRQKQVQEMDEAASSSSGRCGAPPSGQGDGGCSRSSKRQAVSLSISESRDAGAEADRERTTPSSVTS